VTAALLALAASVAWGAGDFLGGLKSRTLPLLTVLLLAQAVGVAWIAVVLATSGESWPGTGVLWAMPAALCGTLGLAAFYRGMATGAISIVAPLAATGAVIPVVAGIALGGSFRTCCGRGALGKRDPALAVRLVLSTRGWG
jgi:uncharacterized membrane protein